MSSTPSVKSSPVTTGPALKPMGHHEGKPAIRLTRPVYIIGARSSCRIHLLSSSVSKAHALLVRSSGRTYIRDLASRSKVYINGEEIREAILNDGDLIKIGTFTFQYIAGPGEDRRKATKPPLPAKFEVSGAELPVPIDERVLVLGRRSRCDIHLLEDTVSTSHAVIFEMDGQRYVRDLGSRTGTYVNGVSTHQHMLSPHDTIRVGDNELRYIVSEPATAGVVEEDLGDNVVDSPEAMLEQTTPATEAPASLAVEAPEPAATVEPEPIPVELETPVAQPASSEDEAIPVETEELAPAVEAAAPAEVESESEPIPLDIELPPAELEVEAVPETLESEAAEIPVAEAPVRAAASAEFEPLEIVEPELPEPVLQSRDEVEEQETADEPIAVQEPAAAFELPAAADEVEEPVEPVAAESKPAPLELVSELPESIEEIPSAEAAFPLAEIDLPEHAPERLEPEPAMELPTVSEPAAAAVPEPALELVEPHQIDIPAAPAAPAAKTQELPLDIAPRPELPAAVEAADDELALDTPPVDEIEPLAPVEAHADDLALDLAPPPAQELSAEPVLPPEPVEVIDRTEPTPQSALQSAEDQLALDALAAPDTPLPPVADELSDTQFDRAVREFSSHEIGEIVEPGAAETIAPAHVTPVEVTPAEEIDLKPDEPAPAEAAFELPEVEADSRPARATGATVPELDLPEIEPEPPAAEVVEPPAPVVPPPSRPAALRPRVPWGANQDNFLGGAPLPLREPARPAPPAPANERAVQELINEIDQVAAKAEAASTAPPAAPPAGGEHPPGIPAILPPRPRRTGPRPQQPRRRPSTLIPTEQAETAPRDLVNTGFDGLANSPLRDMDVFSRPGGHDDLVNVPSGLHDSTAGEAGAGAGGTELSTEGAVGTVAPARRSRVTPALADEAEASAGNRRPQVSYAAEMTEAETTAIRRKYHRRVYMLLGLMVGLIGASFWAINTYLVAPTTVEGTLKYQNLSALTRLQQTEMQRTLLRILGEDGTRRAARAKLLQKPEIGPGFLGEPEDFDRVIQQAGFSDGRPDLLVVRVVGRDPERDSARVSALLSAQYELNKFLVDDAKRAQRELKDLNDADQRDRGEFERLNREIEVLRLMDESRPAPQQLSELQAEVERLESQADEAYRKVRDAEAELDELRTSPAGGPGSGGTPAAAAESDERLRAMLASLTELQKKVTESKTATAEQAGAARRTLDGALDAFQQQVASAQGMFSTSPALAAYIQDAQRLQETTRQLTDELIRKQETQVARLIELKERQNDRMEQRRIEIWQGDQQLKDLTERLAIAERQYNAAVGGGLQREATDKKSEIELIRSMIKARQELLPGDSFFADMIRELQEFIDSTRKDIQEDRRKTEEVLASRQQAFVSSQAIRNLPEEQKLVASQMQEKLQQVTEARKQYNAAVDVGTTDGDSQLKAQIATLQAAIDARRTELAEASQRGMQAQQEQARQAAIQPKQDQVNKLKEAEAQASAAFVEKSRQLREAARVTASEGNADRLSTLVSQKDKYSRQLTANVAQKENKLRAVALAVEPIAPTDDDIRTTAGNDRRPLYMGISAGVIGLLFCVLIFLTLHAASVKAPAVSIQAADLTPDSATPAQPANGEAPKAGKSDDDEEDHEPAVV